LNKNSTSIIDAAAHNEVLQIVCWSILFAVALAGAPESARQTLLPLLDGLAQVMFRLTSIVMTYAPIGIGAAIAVTVRAQLTAVRRLLADSRALEADRAFLVQITATTAPAEPRTTLRPRRAPVRLVRPAQASAGPRWRAAA
jgi:Na+/serine symporter